MSRDVKAILKRAGYPDRAEHEWFEFAKTYRSAFGRDLPDTDALGYVAEIFGRSFYLVQRLLNHPDLADRLFQSDFLKRPKSTQRFEDELSSALEPAQGDMKAVMRVLRHYRYEEYLRLTVRDLAGLSTYVELGQERSALADVSIHMAFMSAEQELIREYGRPFDESGDPSAFTVLGMGKLGGEDLNYSSDVDLIYLYSSDAGRFERAGSGGITHHEFYVRLSESLSRLLSERTADGFVYRVDMDLRPEGNKGTLANSLEAMESYYESFGDNWERMALTKARTVAGSKTLGDTFWQRVDAFVYPKTSDFSTLEQVRDLKNRIEQSLQRKLTGGVDPKSPAYNVKLGIGGIREIEFFIGSFQRLYGGNHRDLKARSTLEALQQLVVQKLIKKAEGANLSEAYQFLRRVENHLQMFEDRQTHSLPRSRDELSALAKNLYPKEETAVALDKFQEELLLHTEKVRLYFEALFAQSS